MWHVNILIYNENQSISRLLMFIHATFTEMIFAFFRMLFAKLQTATSIKGICFALKSLIMLGCKIMLHITFQYFHLAVTYYAKMTEGDGNEETGKSYTKMQQWLLLAYHASQYKRNM